MVTESGRTEYEYDALGRMVTMTDAAGRETTYTWDAAGHLTGVTNDNGASTEYGYDDDGYLAEVNHLASDGAVMYGETYDRDASGRVTAIDGTDGSSTTYRYDLLGRLLEEVHTPAGGGGDETTTWEYDAVGNRIAITDSGGRRDCTTDANGRLLDDGDFTYSYDDNGNVTRREGGSEVLVFSYDGRGRLSEVTREAGSGPSLVRYRYDPLGVLVSREVDGEVQRLLTDRAARFRRVIEESASDGAILARNFFGPVLTSREEGATLTVFHLDHLGSVRTLSDGAGDHAGSYEFDAFGNERGGPSEGSNPYRFAGERYDAATGAYDLRTRHYWPEAGRFLQMDPAEPDLTDTESLHRYVYAMNDPVNRIDPSGRYSMIQMLAALAMMDGIRGIPQTLSVNLAVLAFAMAGGFQLFTFPGGPDGHDGEMRFSRSVEVPGQTLTEERWYFFRGGIDATYMAWGISLPIGGWSIGRGVWNDTRIWDCPEPGNYEGPSFTLSFAAGLWADLTVLAEHLLPLAPGVNASLNLFFTPIPTIDYDTESASFGQLRQPHGLGWAVGVRVGWRPHIVSAGVGFTFSVYCLVYGPPSTWTCGMNPPE